jgi:hypothetical protein
MNLTINRRSSYLFPIGSSKVNFLSLFRHAVYKFIGSISQIALGRFVLIQRPQELALVLRVSV